MSDTPRTDAVEFYAGDLDGGQEAVPADFARQLERENERLRAVLREIAFDAERLVPPAEIVAKARIAAGNA